MVENCCNFLGHIYVLQDTSNKNNFTQLELLYSYHSFSKKNSHYLNPGTALKNKINNYRKWQNFYLVPWAIVYVIIPQNTVFRYTFSLYEHSVKYHISLSVNHTMFVQATCPKKGMRLIVWYMATEKITPGKNTHLEFMYDNFTVTCKWLINYDE